MVVQTYDAALKVKKEMEHIAESSMENSGSDTSEQELKETRQLAESLIREALKVVEELGKNTLGKIIEKTEDITL